MGIICYNQRNILLQPERELFMRQFQELSDEARMQLAIKVLRDSGQDVAHQSWIIRALVEGYLLDTTDEDDTSLQDLYEEICSILGLFCTVVYINGEPRTTTVISLDGEFSTRTLEQIDLLVTQLGGTRLDNNPNEPGWTFNDYTIGKEIAQHLGRRH
jgi:hypothetical protein